MSTFAKVFLTKKRNLTFNLIFTSNISFLPFSLQINKKSYNTVYLSLFHYDFGEQSSYRRNPRISRNQRSDRKICATLQSLKQLFWKMSFS